MFTQLNPPIPMHSLDHGAGMAIAVIDYGADFDLCWVFATNDGGAIWCIPNAKARAVANYSLGRTKAVETGADATAWTEDMLRRHVEEG
jgi:hypothetical protein